MARAATNPKQEAHELIDRLSTGQVSAVVGLLEAMLDPVSVALANAPIDDEPVPEEEAHADRRCPRLHRARRSHSSRRSPRASSASKPEDFERMGRTPLEPEPRHPGQ